MSFEKVAIDQAIREYEANLDAIGLRDPQRGLLVDAMRAELEGMESLIAAIIPAVATGEYLDRWLDHKWRGPMGAETKAPDDEPRQNHLRDAVRNNW